MRKKIAVEEPMIEIVNSPVDVNPAPAVPKKVGHSYCPVGNDVPWFVILLVQPDAARPHEMIVTEYWHTWKYEQACTEATRYARRHVEDRFIPVSREGWPP